MKMMGGSSEIDRALYHEPKKTHGPETLHPREYLESKFLTQKNTRP